MMFRRIFLTFICAAAGCVAAPAQGSIERVLAEIEANNLTLKARASLSEAGALEARTGNSLPDPELGYDHLWGRSPESGTQGEFTAVQPFDFPTAYAARNKLARLRGRQFASEYDLYRQEVLSEAHGICLELIAMRRRRALLDRRAGLARELASASQRRFAEGAVDALHVSESRVQYLAAANALRLMDVGIADAEGRLKILNGGVETGFADADFPVRGELMPFEAMLELYLESDPAILAAAAAREAAGQQVRAARSESLPKLALGYKLEHGNGERFQGVTAGVSIPMFGNRNNVKRAAAERRYAELADDDTRARARQQLATLYAKAALLEESIAGYMEIMEDTEQYLSNLRRSLDAGRITVTDYFSQYDGITAYEEAFIEFLLEYHQVRAQIYSVFL